MNEKPENFSKVGLKNDTKTKPNETGSFSVEAYVKIFDPESKEIYVEKRA